MLKALKANEKKYIWIVHGLYSMNCLEEDEEMLASLSFYTLPDINKKGLDI